MTDIVDVTNDLTPEQRLVMSDKLETLMTRASRNAHHAQPGELYWEGLTEGLNNAYKLVNEINDDYNME